MQAVNLTNSSTTNSRRALDYYPTPPEATHALVRFLHDNDLIDPHAYIWEPACGDGAMAEVISSYGHRVVSTDIRHTGYGIGGIDYLLRPADEPVKAIITNPPFAQAEDFIRKAAGESPLVAMLLKSQYWHASKRTKLFTDHPPAWVLPLNWRPDFLAGERGGAPTMDVIWTVWIRGQQDTRYRILSKQV